MSDTRKPAVPAGFRRHNPGPPPAVRPPPPPAPPPPAKWFIQRQTGGADGND